MAVRTRAASRVYDEAYFDKWYRSPRHRVKSSEELDRQSRFVLGASDFILGRPTRTVLDVGCGEGQWRAALRRLRPGLRYWGVDASDYAVRRYGRRRSIQRGTIETLDTVALPAKVDLVLCVGMLNYVASRALRAGLANVRARTGGVAYLEIFAAEDEVEGDFGVGDGKPARWYRRLLRDAGFVHCGLQLYVGAERKAQMATLELG